MTVDNRALLCDNGAMSSPGPYGPPPHEQYPPHAPYPWQPEPAPRSSKGPLVAGIIVSAIALMVISGVAVAMWFGGNGGGNGDGNGGAGPIAPAAQPTTTVVEQARQPETVTVTEEAPQTTTTRTRAQAATPDDLGTGHPEVDARGWPTPGARCHAGDRAFAVIQAETGARAAACQTPNGYRYYRGHDPNVGSLETEIYGTSESDVVAKNGAVTYQMSFAGLLITDENGTVSNSRANVWGRVDLD